MEKDTFNNVLSVILSCSDHLLESACSSAEVHEEAGQIRLAALRASELTSQLLAFSRQSIMQREHLDLNDLVATDVVMLRRLVSENIKLELTLHRRPLTVHADESMIAQVLLNLAVNARDAMPGGGRLLIATSERVVAIGEPPPSPDAAPGRYACVRVQDSGSGIPPEILPRIFEPFFTTKQIGKGTGLGLATVFGIVRQHGGWITVESDPGRGATFSVFLPLVALPEAALDPGVPGPLPRGTETILLVEDEEQVRLVTRLLLSRHGYRVLEAGHGPAALEIWRQEPGRIDLLLTDLVMPEGLTGQELAAKLQAEAPTLKVVFTTGYSTELAGHDLALPAHQNFLQKPFASDTLLATVRHVLDAR
jgi:CheY-like chemotaxis protein